MNKTILIILGLLLLTTFASAEITSASTINNTGVVYITLTDYQVTVDSYGGRFFISSSQVSGSGSGILQNDSYGAFPFRAGFLASEDQDQYNTLLATALSAKLAGLPLTVVVYSDYTFGGTSCSSTPVVHWLDGTGPNGGSNANPFSKLDALIIY